MLNFPVLKFDHGETIDMLRESVRQFAAREIAPRAADIDRDNASWVTWVCSASPSRRSTAGRAWVISRT